LYKQNILEAMSEQKFIEEGELKQLQTILDSQRENEQKVFASVVQIHNFEVARDEAFSMMEKLQKEIEEMSASFREKYGEVNINAQTGEITEQEESQEE